MPTITTFITFENRADEAAKYYCSVFKNSKILATTYYGDGLPLPKGTVMTVEVELDGQRFVFMNGGADFKLTHALSLMIEVDTQEEVDHYATKLSADGGREVACGWVTDRFGLSWQVTPKMLMRLINDKDPARAKRVMDAMMKMNRLDIATLQRAAG
jgi:predicted 3-demethylubiquinone-9 3-methyltransferase (glyoxalase superfamily)